MKNEFVSFFPKEDFEKDIKYKIILENMYKKEYNEYKNLSSEKKQKLLDLLLIYNLEEFKKRKKKL